MGILLAYPSLIKRFPNSDYFYGQVPKLYEFLAKQPKDILIASLTLETDNLPTFAQRPVLVSREYALPYEVGYYNQIRQRTINLINAQYSSNLAVVKKFIQMYSIDFWLVEKDAFTLEYLKNPTSWADKLTAAWIRQYQPTASEIVGRLNRGTVPALAKTIDRCSVLETGNYILLNANCILTNEK